MQRSKGMYVKQILDMGDNLDIRGLFAISKKEPVKEYRSGYFFVLELSDRTGRVGARVWGGNVKEEVEEVYNRLKIGDVIEVYGRVTAYKDTTYISISLDSGRIYILKEDEYNHKDFINETPKDRYTMLNELKKIAGTVENPVYIKILETFFNDSELLERFAFMPASKLYHHAYIGGLLEHTLGVLKIALSIIDQYDDIDRDLLITAAILHDIGKIKEYQVSGIIDFTLEGNMLGQISLTQSALDRLLEKANTRPSEAEDILKLRHVILSHHGTVERGSFIKPMVPEAVVLYHADLLDSRTKAMLEVKAEYIETTEDEIVFISRRDIASNIYLR